MKRPVPLFCIYLYDSPEVTLFVWQDFMALVANVTVMLVLCGCYSICLILFSVGVALFV